MEEFDGANNSSLALFDLSSITGILTNRKAIALNRLSKYPRQGIEEFQNEKDGEDDGVSECLATDLNISRTQRQLTAAGRPVVVNCRRIA
ncbi:hypothetical protein MTR_4g091740 [Medicago truncatula]|uniref:Uncharacterized protein n=1 Tax=Medicago truncatula TaxID=3880 RepID=G7JSX0_MEDTR|nr:hypothetical protein MTR_4g091740 [Medicago truncatula]